MDEAGVRTLRAKYLDWCSARIAERFLDLSPEEIYELAHAVHSGAAVPDSPGSSTSAGSSARPSSAAPSRPSSSDSRSAPPSSSGSDFPAMEGSGASSDRLPRPEDEGYRALVQRVTESLLEQMPLPTFEQWAEAYREAPERFDPELLGFWKDVVDEGERSGPS